MRIAKLGKLTPVNCTLQLQLVLSRSLLLLSSKKSLGYSSVSIRGIDVGQHMTKEPVILKSTKHNCGRKGTTITFYLLRNDKEGKKSNMGVFYVYIFRVPTVFRK